MTFNRPWHTSARLLVGVERAVLAATVAVAVGYVALFFYVALSRASYPFELEWLEGSMLHEVMRVLEGKPLYQEPSLEYTPFIYPPLYFWLSALSAMLVGPGFLALRSVSIAAAAGCFVLRHHRGGHHRGKQVDSLKIYRSRHDISTATRCPPVSRT